MPRALVRPHLLVAALAALPALAHAQDLPSGPGGARLREAPPVPTSSTSEAPPAGPAAPQMPAMPKSAPAAPEAPPGSPGELDQAWSIYHDAFLDTVMGRQKKARRELERLRAEHPDHPASLLAASLLMRMDELEFGTEEEDAHFGSRRPSGLARAELASAQTISGITFGAWACGLAGCEDARLWVSVLTLGGGAGLTASLVFTQDRGITPGRALAVNSGTAWGVYNGAMIAAIADAEDSGLFGALLAGQLIGTGAGIAVASLSNPTAGDISMATSGGLWLGGAMLFVNAIGEFELFDGRGGVASILVASDLGVAGAAALRAFGVLQMSRSRALLIDVGGIMGSLLGMGLGVLVQGDDATPAGVFGPGLAGMLAGLGGTFWLTRNWDAPDFDMNLAVLPAPGGGLTVGVGGAF